MNQCDESFHKWLSRAYSELPEGEDFPAPDDFMYEVWQAAWRSAYSTGIMRGQKQGRMHMQHLAEDRRKPMPYYEMEELFERSKNGRDYGVKIEQWHGIGK